MEIKEHVLLASHTTFKIGGPARYFCSVTNISELTEAVLFAQKNNLPVFVLGAGSNILVSDNGFDGLVIHMDIQGIEIHEHTKIKAGAGVLWDALVEYAVQNDLYGIENLSYIPGTVGAAPVQNIGAYGAEFKDVAHEVEVFNTETMQIETLTKETCAFGYRDSVFKKKEGEKYIIVEVCIKLKKKINNSKELLNLLYKDVKEYINTHNISKPTLQTVRNAIIDIRKKKLPDIRDVGTAGSFFKNPVITREHFRKLQEKFPNIPSFEVDELHVKIPIAWVLDNVLHLNGYTVGNVGLFKTQPLALVHYGGGTAQEIISLSEKIIFLVKKEIDVTLEREVLFVGVM